MKGLKELYMRGLDLNHSDKAMSKNLVQCKKLEILDISDNNIQPDDQRCHDSIQDLITNTK